MRRQIFVTFSLYLILLAVAAWLLPARAADKGGPPMRIDAQGVAKPLFTGCYGQVGAGGIFASGNDTIKGFVIGAGCDWQVGAIVIGANGKYALYGDDTRALTVGGRLGYAINPHTLAYVHVGALMDGRDISLNQSAIMGGVGLEAYFTRNMTVFIEAATDVKKWGEFRELPQVYEIHGGVRIRF
ncbi:outer membrane channeL [Caudoviricetes sp.]|nr:outer membrane channeL [Caudoviricetes sp.]